MIIIGKIWTVENHKQNLCISMSKHELFGKGHLLLTDLKKYVVENDARKQLNYGVSDVEYFKDPYLQTKEGTKESVDGPVNQ